MQVTTHACAGVAEYKGTPRRLFLPFAPLVACLRAQTLPRGTALHVHWINRLTVDPDHRLGHVLYLLVFKPAYLSLSLVLYLSLVQSSSLHASSSAIPAPLSPPPPACSPISGGAHTRIWRSLEPLPYPHPTRSSACAAAPLSLSPPLHPPGQRHDPNASCAGTASRS